MNNIPNAVIDIEIRQLRSQLGYMLGEHSQAYKAALDRAVAEFFTAESFYAAVKRAVDTELRRAVQEEIETCFRGVYAREALAQATSEVLRGALKDIKPKAPINEQP